jgi:2-keto-4-pentenoate hydratase
MNDIHFHAARAALRDARRSARRVEPLATEWKPGELACAYRLQRAVAADLGPIRGWKVSGLTAEQQRAMGVESALAAPLLGPWLHGPGATLQVSGFVQPRLECEFAFALAADLPSRASAYTRAEVEAAIGTLRLGVEIVDRRLPAGSGVLVELADDLNNGAYVVGTAIESWRDVDYAKVRIGLRRRVERRDDMLAEGDGRAILDGDPVGALILLANLPALHPRGLRAGDIVTTGSCTGAVALPGAGAYQADFGALGTVAFGCA